MKDYEQKIELQRQLIDVQKTEIRQLTEMVEILQPLVEKYSELLNKPLPTLSTKSTQ